MATPAGRRPAADIRALAGRSRTWLLDSWPGIARSPACLAYARPLMALLDQLSFGPGLAAALDAGPCDPAAPGLAGDLARFLAGRAGPPRPDGVSESPDQGRLLALLAAGDEGHRAALAMVESDICGAGSAPLAGELMAGVTIRALRAFDLLSAVRFARASAWLGDADPDFDAMVVSFLATHQRDDGTFLSPEQIRPETRASPERVFILQATVAFHCLWTLAEFDASGPNSH